MAPAGRRSLTSEPLQFIPRGFPTWKGGRDGCLMTDGERPFTFQERHNSGCLSGSSAEHHGFRQLLVQLLQRHG